MSSVSESYVDWLKNIVSDDGYYPDWDRSFIKLLNCLWEIPWEGNAKYIGSDRDREQDGYDLRVQYETEICESSGPKLADIYGSVKVLEVLVAISLRMYDFMLDTNIYNSPSRWFWEIIGNSYLDVMNDDSYEDRGGDEAVENVVYSILKKEEGPLRGWFGSPNWRTMEIWYQMHEYLSAYF